MVGMMTESLGGWVERLASFQVEASTALSKIESSVERRMTLDQSYKILDELSVLQDDLFRQALRCIEVGAYKAAHVMAWSATIDFVIRLCEVDHFNKLQSSYPNWNLRSITNMKDRFAEHNILEAMKKSGYITRNQAKALQGLLAKRNECAHPSDYLPNMNETLGYVSECFSRVKSLMN